MTTKRHAAGIYTITANGREFLVQKADETGGWLFSEKGTDGLWNHSEWAPSLTEAKGYIAAEIALAA